MKKAIFIFALLSLVCKIYGRDLSISFQPKVSGTQIDSIQAINLRTKQIVKLSGGESLLLVKIPTSINPLQNKIEKGIIYPNPSNENATFCFSSDKGKEVEIRLFNASGQVLNQNRQYLAQGTHRFELKFPVAGIYFVSLLKSNESASFKVVYTGKTIQNSSISYAGSEKLNSQKSDINQLKSATTGKALTYTEGDFIQYSVSSGVNTTIITETPTVSKTFDVEFVSCIGNDNKSYKAVKFGTLWWMAENLVYLPAVYPSESESYTDSRYYVYDYQGTDVATAKNNANYSTYGVLYNWPAALTACPPGWHLPSDAEWKQLEMALGMTQAQADEIGARGTDQGAQMKATSGWYNNGNGTNSSGFAALPAGYRCNSGTFTNIGYTGIWWSSAEDFASTAWRRSIHYRSYVFSYSDSKEGGFSVRCVRNVDPFADFNSSSTSITKVQSIQFTDKSTLNSTSWLWDFGDTSTSTEQNPVHTYSTAGIYTVSLKVTNNIGSNTKTLKNYITVTDGTLIYDGKTYQTIIITDKEWMAENLAYLPAVSPPTAGSNTDPYCYVYGYHGTDVNAAKATVNYSNYGVLYNWQAAIAACPPGWHLPSDAEWTALENFLGGGSVAGGKLKESGYTHWRSPNASATNEIGFAALPAGYRFDTGIFDEIGNWGLWWCSTRGNKINEAWYRFMRYNDSGVVRLIQWKEYGFSVRCVRDL